MNNRLVERFIKYCKIDTQSDGFSTTSPSTMKQFDLANVLKDELVAMGVDNAFVDEYCYVYAKIEANCDDKYDKIVFIAHMDTADFNAKGCKPRIIEKYDGKDIKLNDEFVLSPVKFPVLNEHKGKTLIVTDGTTLLGADDKAGVAAIMESVQYLMEHPEVKHGTFYVVFTPDEEVGRGTEHFDLDRIDCDYGFTIDGGCVSGVCDETFNAASATVKVKGVSVHPGEAKDKMVNANNLAIEFHNLLDSYKRPEHTDGYDGFYHLLSIKGEIEDVELQYIIREHDFAKLEAMVKDMLANAEYLNRKYHNDFINVDIKYSYRNMHDILKDYPHIMELVNKTLKQIGLTPYKVAARGGTDGANLTFRGLPCPNLGAGGYNYHGRYEYLVVEELEKAHEMILKLLENVKRV